MKCSIHSTITLITGAVFALCLLIGVTPRISDAGQEQKRVFVLNSFNHGYTWTDNMLRGIEDAFGSSGVPVETYVTYMDMKRAPATPQHIRNIKELIREGYKGVRFDAVLACDNDAFEFAKNYRDELFPGVPVVFSSINDFDERMLDGRRDITGTSENTDYIGTIKVALKLLPATTNIVVVTDDTTTGKAHRSAIEKIRSEFSQRIGFTYISLADMTMDDLAGKLSQLERNSIVLLLQHFKDKDGTSYTVQQSTPLLTKSSSVPAFVLTDIRIGLGALGGHVVSGYHHGEAAAHMVVKILKGADVQSIPVLLDSPNRYMFDYRVMQRFKIAEKDLPRGSILINRPESLMDKYRPYLFAIIGALVLLSAFVAYLLLEIKRRKKIETSLRLSRISVDAASDSLFWITPDARIVDVNEAACRSLGYTREELLGLKVPDVDSNFKAGMWPQRFSELRKHGSLTFESEHRTKDGRVFPVEVATNYIKGDDAEWNCAFVRDISGRKNAEASLQAAFDKLQEQNEELQMAEEEYRNQNDELLSVEEMLRDQIQVYEASQKLLKENEDTLNRQLNLFSSLLQILPIGVFMTEAPSGKPLIANDAAYRLLGRGILPDASIGELSTVYNAYKAGTHDPYPPGEMPIVLAMSGVASRVDDMEIERPDGTRTLLEIIGAPVTDDQGNVWAGLVSFNDITERKMHEKELLDAEWKFQALFNNGPIGVAYHSMIYDTYGKPVDYFFIDANDNYLQLTGVDPRGKTVTEAFPGIENDPFDWIGTFGRVARTGEAIHFEQYLESNNRWYDVVGYQYKPDHFVASFVEITDRKLAEEALQESEFRWKFALEGARDGVWDWNIQTGETFFSRRYKEMLGFAENEISNSSDEWFKRIHPEDFPGTIAALQPYLDGKAGSPRIEFRMVCKDGSWKWIVGRGMIVSLDGDGRPLRMIGTNTDITDRKLAEERLNVLSQRLLLATSSARLAVWDWNVRDNLMYWDDRMFELYGITSEAFSNTVDAWLSMLHPEDRESAVAASQAALNGEQEFNSVFRVLHPDGTVRHIKGNAIVIRGTDGTAERMIGINYDITESKLAEKELLQAKIAADSANRTKSQFLANMSHEIRTPMNGIIAISQLLAMTELNEEQREYTDLLTSSSRNLLKLISDILDLSRIESGSVELEFSDFDLSAELQSTALMNGILAKGKGLEFDFQIDPDVPLLLTGDSVRLRQIVTNLIGNAIKFTAEGSISLHISKDDEDDQHATLRFLVRDSGIGIAQEHVESIFDAFTQAVSSSSLSYGGTGLGLSISRHLVELMGGSIGVETREGCGSSFWFTVTLRKPALPPEIAVPIQDDEANNANIENIAIRILLVEDDEANQVAFSRLLSKTRHQVKIAENGIEALQMLEENDFDAVLMDCRMPLMDGYEATAVIRDPGSRVRNHTIPIIALTANALQEDRKKCLDAGMDDYMSKPIEYEVLLALLEKWTRHH